MFNFTLNFYHLSKPYNYDIINMLFLCVNMYKISCYLNLKFIPFQLYRITRVQRPDVKRGCVFMTFCHEKFFSCTGHTQIVYSALIYLLTGILAYLIDVYSKLQIPKKKRKVDQVSNINILRESSNLHSCIQYTLNNGQLLLGIGRMSYTQFAKYDNKKTFSKSILFTFTIILKMILNINF